MTKREKKIASLKQKGLSEKQIAILMRKWDLDEIRIWGG